MNGVGCSVQKGKINKTYPGSMTGRHLPLTKRGPCYIAVIFLRLLSIQDTKLSAKGFQLFPPNLPRISAHSRGVEMGGSPYCHRPTPWPPMGAVSVSKRCLHGLGCGCRCGWWLLPRKTNPMSMIERQVTRE